MPLPIYSDVETKETVIQEQLKSISKENEGVCHR